MADKLLFILTYLKQHPIQEVQGQLCGMSQANANKWIHLLHNVLNHALARQALLPARTTDDFAMLLAAHRAEGVPRPPLVGMMALNARSTARPMPRNNRSMTVGRRRATRSNTCS